MPYAMSEDIVTLYGQDALVVADHDRDGLPKPDALARALASASAEIDTHLAVRYALPLHEVPEFLTQICVDIAVYRLATRGDLLTAEMRTRYDDALAYLRRIADGKARLVFTTPIPEPVPDPTGASGGPQPIVAGGGGKVFTRDLMRDL